MGKESERRIREMANSLRNKIKHFCYTGELSKSERDRLLNALESQRWIPVSERLPEDHKDVLICLSSDQICIGCYNSHKLPFSNNVIGWGASYAHNWCNNDVIAWMPQPGPYKAESEDKE